MKTCKDCKFVASELIKQFMIEFDKKIKEARKKVKKIKFILE